jgi:hypothetical protein
MMHDNRPICLDCGHKYLTEKQLKGAGVCTCWKGICRECGEEKPVTDIRHFNYLQLSQPNLTTEQLYTNYINSKNK